MIFKISTMGFRSVSIDGNADVESLVSFIAATETDKVKRYVYDEDLDEVIQASEVLRCDPGSVRFNATAVLLNHNGERIVGPIKELGVSDRKVIGAFEFDDTDDADRARKQVKSGSLRGISAGYVVHRYQLVRKGDTWDGIDGPALVATDWEIREVSLTPIPADTDSGITREQLKRGASVCIDAGTIDLQNQQETDMIVSKGLRSLLFEPDTGAGGGGSVQTKETEPVKPAPQTRGVAPTAPAATPAPTAPAAKPAPASLLQGAELLVAGPSAAEVQLRASHILLHCKNFGVDSRAADFVNDPNITAEEVRLKLDAERAAKIQADATTGQRGAVGGSHVIQVGENNQLEGFRSAFSDAMMIRGNVIDARGNNTLRIEGARKVDAVKVHDLAPQMSGLSMIDQLRSLMEIQGVRAWGKSNGETIALYKAHCRSVGMAGTSDYITLLENAMNKMTAQAYEVAPSTYEKWVRVINAKDLRPHGLYQKGGLGRLKRINGDKGEVPVGNQHDGKKESVTPYTHSALFALTDEVIINDDLGMITDFAVEIGETTRLTKNEHVYYELLSNPTMLETGYALFSTQHGNLVTSGAVPSIDTFNVAFKSMSYQTNRAGRVLNLRPTHILSPAALEGTVKTLLRSQFVPGGTNATINIHQGAVEPIFEALLDLGSTIEIAGKESLTVAGNPAGWYLLSRMVGSLVLAEYGGSAPIIDQERPIDVLATVYRGTSRFGVAAEDYRGVFYNDGAT